MLKCLHDWFLPAPGMPLYKSAWINGLRFVLRGRFDWWDENGIGNHRSETAIMKLERKRFIKTDRILGRRPASAYRVNTFMLGSME